MDENDKFSGVMCCFCNQGIISDDLNPCDIVISSNWDKEEGKQNGQNFWCHLECFRTKLDKDIQQHLVLHLLTGQ